MPRIVPPPPTNRVRRKISINNNNSNKSPPLARPYSPPLARTISAACESLMDVDSEVQHPLSDKDETLSEFDPISSSQLLTAATDAAVSTLNPFRLYDVSEKELKYEAVRKEISASKYNNDSTELSTMLEPPSDVTIGSILDELDKEFWEETPQDGSRNPFVTDSFLGMPFSGSDPTSLSSNDSGMLSGSVSGNTLSDHVRSKVHSSAL